MCAMRPEPPAGAFNYWSPTIHMVEAFRREGAPFVNRKMREPKKLQDMWDPNAKYVFRLEKSQYKTHQRGKTEEKWDRSIYDSIELANQAAREVYEGAAHRTETDGWKMEYWDDGRVWYNCNDWGHRETVEIRIWAELVRGADAATDTGTITIDGEAVREAVLHADWQELRQELRDEMKEEAWRSVRILRGLVGTIKEEMKQDIGSWPGLRQEIKQQLSENLEVQKKLLFELKQRIRDGIWTVLKDNLQDRILEDEDLRVELIEEARRKVKHQIQEEEGDEMRESLKSDMKDELEDELREEIKRELEEDLEEDLRAEITAEMEDELEENLRKEVTEKLKKQMNGKRVDKLRKEAESKVISEFAINLSRDLQVQLSGAEGTKLREEIRRRVEGGRSDAGASRSSTSWAKPIGVRKRGKRHHDRKSY